MRSCTLIILAMLLCTFSGCSQMNTRIGWPWTYWEHGFWPVIGLLVIYALLPVYVGLICALAEDHQPALLWTIVLLVMVGLVLQMLPPTASGIQFVPLPPWYYVGWIARIISAACWVCLVATCIAILATTANPNVSVEDRCTCGQGFFFVLCLNALLSFATPVGVTASNVAESSPPQVAPSVPDHPPPQNQLGDNQIAQWERRKDEQTEALAKLLSDKEALRDRIGRLGARNKQEVMASELGRTLMEEFEQLARQIAMQQQEVKISEVMIERTKSRLRSLEREALLRGTKVTDEEYRAMCGTDHVLEEELRRRAGEKTPGSEVHLDRLLDEVLRKEN